jgi:hypothetical protein
MSDWPEYVSHKKVRAAKIVGISPADENGVSTIYVRPAGDEYDNGQIEDFEPTRVDMKSAAEIGAYAVIYAPDEKYPEGYRSISPAKAFEEGYQKV